MQNTSFTLDFPVNPEDLPRAIHGDKRISYTDLITALTYIKANFGIHSSFKGDKYLFLSLKDNSSRAKSGPPTIMNMNYDGVCYRMHKGRTSGRIVLLFKWKMIPRVKRCESLTELESYLNEKHAVYPSRDGTSINLEVSPSGKLNLSTRSHLYKRDSGRDLVSLSRVIECIGEDVVNNLQPGSYEFIISHHEINKTKLVLDSKPQAVYIKRDCDPEIEGVESYKPIVVSNKRLINYYSGVRRDKDIWGFIIVSLEEYPKMNLIISSENHAITETTNYKTKFVPIVSNIALDVINKKNNEAAVVEFMSAKGKVEIIKNSPDMRLFTDILWSLSQLIVLDNPFKYKLMFEKRYTELTSRGGMTEDEYDELIKLLAGFAKMSFRGCLEVRRGKGPLPTRLESMRNLYTRLVEMYNRIHPLQDISCVLGIKSTERDIERLRGDGTAKAAEDLYDNFCNQTSYEKYIYCAKR